MGGGKKKQKKQGRELRSIKNENTELHHFQEIQTLMYQQTHSVFSGLNIILLTGERSKKMFYKKDNSKQHD